MMIEKKSKMKCEKSEVRGWNDVTQKKIQEVFHTITENINVDKRCCTIHLKAMLM